MHSIINMHSIIRKDTHCAGKLFVLWGSFGLGMAALWGLAHGNPAADAAIWALGLVAAFALILAMQEL
ncbi:MAG: hypothetical protein WAK11_05300 [Candidatus Cybelea sp.]